MIARAPASSWWRAVWCALVVMPVYAGHGQTSADPPAEPGAVKPAVPGDFLDAAAKQLKARWRQLYREPPPTPTSERLHVAFTLGGLVADSYLALQAGDAQQFKNNSQDLLNYCRVLGLAEKVTPDVMAGSKMAETEDWPALRKQVQQTHQHIEALLNEQRDEDLALLMRLGMWVRLLDITTSLVLAEPTVKDKSLSIGSMSLLNELVATFDSLSEATRANEAVALIGGVLEMLQRHWANDGENQTQELVEMTRDKLKFVIGKLAQK